MLRAFFGMTLQRRNLLRLLLCLLWSNAVLWGRLTPALSQQEPAFTPLSLAVADFATEGMDPSLGADAAHLLREVLAEHPLIDLNHETRTQELLASTTLRILCARPGVARGLAQELNVRVLVFGVLWADADGNQFLQMMAVDCRPRVGRLYATPALPWPQGADAQETRLLSTLQAVLPPVGRVLAIITTNERSEIQVFPFAGHPLKINTTYLALRALTPSESGERPDFVPLLWPGRFTGRLITAAQRLDDVITSQPQGDNQIEIGDLVHLALTEEVFALPSPARLLLSDPPLAQVRQGDRRLGLTPLPVSADQLPGDFQLSLHNYEDELIQLAAVTGVLEGTRVQLTELPLFGTLVVTTDPQGATVSLDGKEIGKAPLTRPAVSAGEHTLVAELPGYHPIEKRVEIERAQEAEVHLVLARQMRAVSIASQPEGAEVSWDGKVIGQTPAQIARTPVGKHVLLLALAGYDEVAQDVEIAPGDQPTELSFDLIRQVGNLQITTTPQGGQVIVAGEPRGAAPVELQELSPGDYEISATLAGYRLAERVVQVKAYETMVVELVLARQVGNIFIKTVPPGAQITLDGEKRGATPATLQDIPVGEHLLRLEVENLRPWENKVLVVDDETTQVQVGLLPLQIELGDQPKPQPVPTVPELPEPPVLPPAPGPGAIREFEGSDEPISFPLIDLSGGKQHTWTVPLLGPEGWPGAPAARMQFDFQPHADGSLTASLKNHPPLSGEVRVETNADSVIVTVPSLLTPHNPLGVRVKDGGLRAVKLTNGGSPGNVQVEFSLAPGAEASVSRPTRDGQPLVLHIRPRAAPATQKMIALTFDDTPFPEYTERLLQLLREHRVVATFFIIGHKASALSHLVRIAYQDGHNIQNHSFTHPQMTRIRASEIRFELQRCNEVIEQITGEAPSFYRAPGGQINRQVRRIAADLGLQHAGWDVNVHDYNTPDADLIANRVVKSTCNGDIILLHDGVEATLQALPDIIRRLRAKGYTFVTLDQLLNQ